MNHPLAEHASPTAVHIWTDHNRRTIAHQIWAEVLRFHIEHGVVDRTWSWVPDRLEHRAGQIDEYELEQRERRTRHDLKALLEQTIHETGCDQVLHLGMTSADIVDNATQIQIAQALDHLGHQLELPLLLDWPTWYPLRGIRGAVGTQQDQLDLLGDPQLCNDLDQRVAQRFGFHRTCISTGQMSPRSVDLQAATAAACTIPPGPWAAIANGYLQMVAGYAGDTWNDGDVSSSVVRRVALPGIMLAADAAIWEDVG